MIKKLIGIIVALAVIVVIVVAVIERDSFQSMELGDGIFNQTPSEPQTPTATPAPAAVDTLSTLQRPDSL